MSETSLILAYPESGHQIRTIHNGNEVMFCLADVVKFLADQNTQLAYGGRGEGLAGLTRAIINALDPDECHSIEGSKNQQDAQYITQPGLFRIILRDSSPACKNFQRWVFHEVLPSIQKHGTYPPPISTESSDVRKAVMLLLDEIDERERLERETKQRFEKNERRLDELSEIISTHSLPDINHVYRTVDDFCQSNNINLLHEHMIFGWCLKICMEKGQKSYQTHEDGQKITKFPEPVISEAWTLVQKQKPSSNT
ncbi:Bro-N domain-containing protein [Vreelandella sp. F11]|uniref:BRO-N domain-containing protein n=1 Tax=Vreelandella sp. F11 TaxID=3394751 RepID=UPI0036D8AF3D